jgi:hypothetical protein
VKSFNDSELITMLKAIKRWRNERIKSFDKLNAKWKAEGKKLDRVFFDRDMVTQKGLIDMFDKELISRGINRGDGDVHCPNYREISK